MGALIYVLARLLDLSSEARASVQLDVPALKRIADVIHEPAIELAGAAAAVAAGGSAPPAVLDLELLESIREALELIKVLLWLLESAMCITNAWLTAALGSHCTQNLEPEESDCRVTANACCSVAEIHAGAD